MLARTIAAGITFVIPLALARTFPQDQYGTYKLLTIVAQMLYYVLPFGMAQSLYFFLPRATKCRAYLMQTLAFLLGIGFFALVALAFGSRHIARVLNNAALPEYILPLGLYVLGLVGSMPLEMTQTARGRTNLAAFIYVVSECLKALAMTAPALLGWGLKGVMHGIAAFALVRLAVTWIVLLRGESGPFIDRSGLREQIRYAVPFGAAMALAVPQQYFHQFVVSSHLDAATFALYAVGVLQLPILDLLYTPTTEVLMVQIAEFEREGRPEAAAAVFREAVGRLAQAFIPLAAFLVLMAPEFMTALFTSRYLGAAPVFRVVSLGVVLGCLPVDGALRAKNETRHIFNSYLIKAIITVPLVLLCVAHWGMMGGVCSWLAAETVGKVTLFLRVPRALNVFVKNLLPWSELLRVVGATLIAASVAWAAWKLMFNPLTHAWLVLIATAALYGFGYLAVLAATGADLPFALPLIKRNARMEKQADQLGR